MLLAQCSFGLSIPYKYIVDHPTSRQCFATQLPREGDMLSKLSIKYLAVIGTAIVFGMGAAPTKAETEPTSEPIGVGALVHLRSGGPVMTVKSVNGDEVTSVWVDEDGNVRSATFPLALLTVEEPVPPETEGNERAGDAAFDRYMRHHCPSVFEDRRTECSE
jgi:uncharacterized protein YodC (DUF2158 family)